MCARLHRIEVTGEEEEEAVFFRETNRFCMQMYDNNKKSYSTIKMPIFIWNVFVCWLRWHVCNVGLLTVASLSRLLFTFLHIIAVLSMRFDVHLNFIIFFHSIPCFFFLVKVFFLQILIRVFISLFLFLYFISELARITWKSCIYKTEMQYNFKAVERKITNFSLYVWSFELVKFKCVSARASEWAAI